MAFDSFKQLARRFLAKREIAAALSSWSKSPNDGLSRDALLLSANESIDFAGAQPAGWLGASGPKIAQIAFDYGDSGLLRTLSEQGVRIDGVQLYRDNASGFEVSDMFPLLLRDAALHGGLRPPLLDCAVELASMASPDKVQAAFDALEGSLPEESAGRLAQIRERVASPAAPSRRPGPR